MVVIIWSEIGIFCPSEINLYYIYFLIFVAVLLDTSWIEVEHKKKMSF